jgi:hypothetical protein
MRSRLSRRKPSPEQAADPPAGFGGHERSDLDAAIAQIWTGPETLACIRDYVARTLGK